MSREAHTARPRQQTGTTYSHPPWGSRGASYGHGCSAVRPAGDDQATVPWRASAPTSPGPTPWAAPGPAKPGLLGPGQGVSI